MAKVELRWQEPSRLSMALKRRDAALAARTKELPEYCWSACY